MCSFEPRNKSSSGAWMVAQNDVPLVADYVAGTSSLIRHLTKDLPASHPLITAARRHIEQGKVILDVSEDFLVLEEPRSSEIFLLTPAR